MFFIIAFWIIAIVLAILIYDFITHRIRSKYFRFLLFLFFTSSIGIISNLLGQVLQGTVNYKLSFAILSMSSFISGVFAGMLLRYLRKKRSV